jgi:uncharacterized protein YvpB
MVKAIKIANELYKHYKSLNEDIPNINNGGCGAFAEHLYLTLVKLGLKPTLAVATNNILAMEYRIKAWRLFGEKAECTYQMRLNNDYPENYFNYERHYGYAIIAHIIILLDGKFIDSSGVYSKFKTLQVKGRYEKGLYEGLPIEVLKAWNDKGTFWNNDFNRQHIKTIEKKLEVCYNKVKKSLVVSK